MPETVVTPPPAPRLFLIDGYALIYRAFFALISRPLTTSRGENTSAAWGVVNFLQRLLKAHRPEYIGWVHDSGLSFRHERFPAYKATREKLTEELQSDFDRGMERICVLLDAYRVPVLSLRGFEADDLIGTLARQAVDRGVNVVVVSGDKDFQQLVRPGVWLLNPGRGGPATVDEQWVGLENAADRLGVPPTRVTDYLALVGDSSDNIPGVRGIGEKTALELVEQFGSLEAILANASTIAKKRPREALLEQGDMARLSKELVTIRDDLPATLDLDALVAKDPDRERLGALFVELEFHTLAREMVAAIERPAAAAQDDAGATEPAPRHYRSVDTVAAMQELVRQARAAGHFALDVQVVAERDAPLPADPLRSWIVGLTIAIAPDDVAYLPLAHRDRQAPPAELALDLDAGGVATVARPRSPKKGAAAPTSRAAKMLAEGTPVVANLPGLADPAMEPLRALLEDATIRKTAHNAKFELLALRRAGVALAGVDFDTMIASYVLDPGRRSHAIDVLALELLGHTLTTFEEVCGKGREAIPFDEIPVECARDFSGQDAEVTLRLRDLLEPQLDALALAALFRDVELPLLDVLAGMEWEGVAIDLTCFAALKERFTRERQRVEREIYELAGETFNINSNPKLREILFEKLGLPVLKRTPTGPSTDATVLQQLADEGHALPVLLMEYRELAKLESTYIDALPALVNPRTGRLHTSFNQAVAATGRLSSSDPNLQNIPIRRELGRDIRRGFVPRAGCSFLGADYSQIELRLLAHLSGDPAFVEAFRTGGDIHRQTAALIFEIGADAVTSEMRSRAKTINFATIYGQGAHALAQQLRIPYAEAREFIARYFERFARVREYLDSQIAFAREHGYVTTIFNRRRYIPELRDRNFNIRAFGERTAANSPIQGSAADLIKVAMINVARAIADSGMEGRMLLQVHDELVFEAPATELDRLTDLVKREMEHAASLSVPLVVDIATGANWLETKLG